MMIRGFGRPDYVSGQTERALHDSEGCQLFDKWSSLYTGSEI